MRSARDDVRGPHRFAQKRPPTFVSALQSVSAAETAKNQLWRDFRCRSIFDFFNTIRHKRLFVDQMLLNTAVAGPYQYSSKVTETLTLPGSMKPV